MTAAVRPCSTSAKRELLVRLDGRQLRRPDGPVLASLGDDEHWYTPDGSRCTSLTVPAVRASAHVDDTERKRVQRECDRAWMQTALDAITGLAANRPSLTSDQVWEAVALPPREARMIGNALRRAHAAGLIEPTDEHRPSTRSLNHRRPVRVWRSLRHGQHTARRDPGAR
jgi:hypothetical protein